MPQFSAGSPYIFFLGPSGSHKPIAHVAGEQGAEPRRGICTPIISWLRLLLVSFSPQTQTVLLRALANSLSKLAQIAKRFDL